MRARAKFYCQTATPQPGGETVNFMPVTSTDPNSENHQFWSATPSGYIQLFITNPDLIGKFKPGTEYYIDFFDGVEEEKPTEIEELGKVE